MAVRKFVLIAGQSNAMEVADAMGWEDLQPYLALRSDKNEPGQSPEFSAGSYTGITQLPYTFAGGAKLGWKNDGNTRFPWAPPNTAGRASQAIQYLTFYNPIASRINLGDSWATTYPHQGTIAEVIEPDVVRTDVHWQYDPVGLVITRQRTGQTYTVAAAANPGWDATARYTHLKLTTPIAPAPDIGEVFTYEVKSKAVNGSNNSEMFFSNRFGGINDIGSALDVVGTSAATETTTHACTVGASNDPIGARVTIRSRPASIGERIVFSLPTLSTTAYIASTGGEMGNGSGTPTIIKSSQGHRGSVGDPIRFAAGNGTLPGAIVAGTTYYIHSLTDPDPTTALTRQMEIRTTAHGASALDLVSGATFAQGATGPFSQPVDQLPAQFAQAGDGYYIVGKAADRQTVALTAASWATDTLSLGASQTLSTGEAVTLSGTLPASLTEGAIYYVVEETATTISLSDSPLGVSKTWASSHSGVATLTRIESGCQYYVSATAGGEPISLSGVPSSTSRCSNPMSQLLTVGAAFRGSLTGLQARCTAGANAGEARELADLHLDSAGTIAVATVSSPWTNAQVSGDTYIIEPPDSIPFEKWAMWMPWSPFEGEASGNGPGLITEAGGASGEEVSVKVVGISTPAVNTKVRIYANGPLPTPLEIGRNYWVHTVGGTTVWLKDSYDATSAIMGDGVKTSLGTTAAVMEQVNQAGKSNPLPPGFNYPNHFALPRVYQPFDGRSILNLSPMTAFHVQLGFNLYDDLGEVIHIAVSAIPGSSIGHKDVAATSDRSVMGWYDLQQQRSWAPGEPSNCYSRTLDVLDTVKTAFAKQGDTGECLGIFFAQGEEDASWLAMSGAYEQSNERLRGLLRAAVKSRGLYSGPENEIPWIQPQISTKWTYASTVNAAITKLSEADAFARTFDVTDFTFMPDGVHYDGKSVSLMGDRAYAEWLGLQRTGYSQVQICNMALSNIGDKGTVTSINPPDGSRQATLCDQFYDLALNATLQRHAWDFSIRRTSPTSVAVDRTEWQNSYYLPKDFVGVLAVLPKSPTDDTSYLGNRTSIEYSIDLDSKHVRRLYCNQADVVLRYHAKVVDTTQYTDLFVQALAWKLSSLLAGPLVKGEAGVGAAQQSQKMFEFLLAQAAGFDAAQTRERRLEDNTVAEWDRARGSSLDLSEWDRYR